MVNSPNYSVSSLLSPTLNNSLLTPKPANDKSSTNGDYNFLTPPSPVPFTIPPMIPNLQNEINKKSKSRFLFQKIKVIKTSLTLKIKKPISNPYKYSILVNKCILIFL